MLEPVKNAEIEDVLSAIRRLISENSVSQPGVQSVEVKAEPDQSAGCSDKHSAPTKKLVLTPDFRVYESLSPSEVEGEHQPESTSDVAEEALAEAGHEEVSSEPEEASKADPLQGVTEGTTDQVETPGLEQPLQLKSEELVEASEANSNEMEWPSEIRKAPQSDATGPLEDRVAELEAAVSYSSVEFEPDLGDAVEDMGPAVFLRQRAEQNWDELVAEVSNFVDAERLIDGTAVDEDSEDNDLNLGDAEDILCDLVVRLVREELQGAVGKKITRSVRRLVRCEVERAITLKGME